MLIEHLFNAMSSSTHNLNRKRPADSEIEGTDPDESPDDHDRTEDFKIKTVDDILQEKRRRIEKEDESEEGPSQGNSRTASPPALGGKRESRTSSKHGSPTQEGGSEIIYQLSPEPQSLSPSK